jgi:betaine reductase
MKIIHYINQFYAQIGGEEKADHPIEVRETVIGPGNLIKSMLSPENEIVATIICGDNYAQDYQEEVQNKITEALIKYEVDVLIAGPAFNAGRYGMACGMACQVAHRSNVFAVSGMYEENPGVELYRKYGFIFPTDNNARGMKKALEVMVPFVEKIGKEESIYDYRKEGYLQRGLRKNIWTEHVGAKRAVDMALNKVYGKPIITELPMAKFSRVTPSKPVEDLSKVKIALLTTCGVVPTGNPDRIESHAATKWKIYHVDDFGGPDLKESEIAHGGYSPEIANKNGNRVMPVDAMIALEKEGYIGSFDTNLYVTVGNSMPVYRAEQFGKEIANSLKENGVSAAILTSA